MCYYRLQWVGLVLCGSNTPGAIQALAKKGHSCYTMWGQNLRLPWRSAVALCFAYTLHFRCLRFHCPTVCGLNLNSLKIWAHGRQGSCSNHHYIKLPRSEWPFLNIQQLAKPRCKKKKQTYLVDIVPCLAECPARRPSTCLNVERKTCYHGDGILVDIQSVCESMHSGYIVSMVINTFPGTMYAGLSSHVSSQRQDGCQTLDGCVHHLYGDGRVHSYCENIVAATAGSTQRGVTCSHNDRHCSKVNASFHVLIFRHILSTHENMENYSLIPGDETGTTTAVTITTSSFHALSDLF